jgi:outer membrane protein OmpA-like peptidoglycan-associated protein/tetratricopeptide (TPR) repeat protein
MKVILISALSILLQYSFAQPSLHKKADTYLAQFQYADAARTFEKMLSTDSSNTSAMEKLILCYRKLNDPPKAEVWLRKICNKGTINFVYWKQYAEVLASNNNYQAAIQWYSKYLQQMPDPEITRLIHAYQEMNRFYSDSAFYKIAPLRTNSPQADFSPMFFHEGIMFSSARNMNQGSSAQYKWDNSAYIDLYYIKNIDDNPISLGKPVNTSLHEGPSAITDGYDTLFFTRNDQSVSKASGKNEVVKLSIYYSIYKGDSWQKPLRFELNNPKYSMGHPAISPDHKLYFVSDMPGGFGGTDLYWTEYKNGGWSAPLNLGTAINTSGNEMFPFVDRNGDLYFASTNHPGLGGLDIFVATAKEQGFSAPANMGYPVNSSSDDFGLIVRGNKGFFSSNRGNPKDDNLYSVTIDRTRPLTIRAVTSSDEHLKNFNIQFFENEKMLEEVPVDTVFARRFMMEKSYRIVASKEGYLKKDTVFTGDQLVTIAPDGVLKLLLGRTTQKITIVTHSVDQRVLAQSDIQIKNLITREISTLQTNDRGLSILELKIDNAYEITASKNNYETKTISLNPSEAKSFEKNDSLILVLAPSTSLFQKNEMGQIIEMDIKYDLNKATIRADATKELDKLIAFLQKNPTIRVELGSHTDSRGSHEANFALSQKRAASVTKYIVSHGIGGNRIIPVGYGEDDLKIANATSEEEHQQNRRTTVKIVGL